MAHHHSAERTLRIQGPDPQLHISALYPFKAKGHVLDPVWAHKQVLDCPILRVANETVLGPARRQTSDSEAGYTLCKQ